ncbi:hypothetical protein ACIA8O_35030 [Kitasatospora sp. NPDC051853]|uniref:hypothetical protein n=1 Tax=Kitasatospora sp. NPDC051853 TaxID=3364058 RepID=UPI0037B298CB
MTDSTRRALRTTLQTVLGLLAALPLLVDSGTLPATLPGLAVAVGVSTTLTRLMALPGVERLLPSWLHRAPGQEPDETGE